MSFKCFRCVQGRLVEEGDGKSREVGNSNFLGIGSDASGVCRTRWLGVPCARKEFHGQASEATFFKEASILSHLKHPRIVNFICCGNGEAKKDRFIAMELMEHDWLFDVIEERKGLHFVLPVAVGIIAQIAKGMLYLHGQGVAHRDLKPQRSISLVDFGMSKTKVEVSKLDTISCRGIGTTRYKTLEVHPKAHLDGLGKAKWFEADVYSFAMTCAHILSLKASFEDMEQLSELYACLLEGERPQLPPSLPWILVYVLGECWDANPLMRLAFGDICRWLCSFRCKMIGGNALLVGLSVVYPTFCRGNIEYFDMKDYKVKKNGEGMGNSIRSSSTGHTSYYSAQDYTFHGGDDSECELD